MRKVSWKIFFDLQCPYSRKCWERLPALKEAFGQHYDMRVYLTSLLFHPQAFTAQCAATWIQTSKGQDQYYKFCDACFENQERYMNAAIGNARKSDIDNVFVDIAQEAGIIQDDAGRAEMLVGMNDWETAVKPAYAEHKIALGFGVYGTPKHVINDVLVADTDSEWGVPEWTQVLSKLNYK